MRKYSLLAGLVVGLLAAIAVHLSSAQAVLGIQQSELTLDSAPWHLQAAIDAIGAVVGFALGAAAAESGR